MTQKGKTNSCMHADSEANLITAQFLSLLSDPTSLMVFNILRKKESDIAAISRQSKITPQIVLNVLNAMKKERIIVSRVKAQTTYYRAASSKLVNAFIRIIDFQKKTLMAAALKKTHRDKMLIC